MSLSPTEFLEQVPNVDELLRTIDERSRELDPLKDMMRLARRRGQRGQIRNQRQSQDDSKESKQ